MLLATDNTALSDGGGLSQTDSVDFTLHRVVLHNNAAKGRGGGLIVQQRSRANLTKVVLLGNHAERGGAAFVALNSIVSLNASVLMNNSAAEGGAIAVDASQSMTTTGARLFSCFTSSNQASSKGGAALRLWGCIGD